MALSHFGAAGHLPTTHVQRVNIGPIGNIKGRIVGLQPALKIVSDVGGPLLGAAVAARSRYVKDYNDEEIDDQPAGSEGGRGVRDQPRGTQRTGVQRGAGTWSDTPFTDEDDEDLARRSRQAGRSNRAYYRRVMGTPKHRPPGS